MRPPDFVIGTPEGPYLRRWWLIPRNRFFNIYLHNICADDDDRALHDHMYENVSVVLKGRYREILSDGTSRIVRRFIPRFRLAETAHRIELIDGPVWTLFICGPRRREWGFICPKGWRHWTQFVNERDTGQIGRGCDD